MRLKEAQQFFRKNFDAVAITFRRNGASQASVVKAGAYKDGVVFVALGGSAKLKNLRRDPRCTLITISPDWGRWCVVEGAVTISDWENTDHEELRLELRKAFKACGGTHDNWAEYDRVMKEDRRAIVLVKPRHVYGQGV